MPPRAEAAASEAGAVSLSGAIAARPADVARAGAGAGGGGSLDGDVRRPSEAKSEALKVIVAGVASAAPSAPSSASAGPARGGEVVLQFFDLTKDVDALPGPAPPGAPTAPKRRRVLHGVSGEALPGEVLVLMGPSGSGKTTLLNSLHPERRGEHCGGLVTINGFPLRKAFKRIIAYVLQEDLFYPGLTVRETLTCTARLRLGGSEAAKRAAVVDIIATLGLQKCADSPIMLCSGGEKKRTSIAAEMLTDPSLLLLDEPTSGLDSTTAAALVKTLKQVARDGGRTVVASIHQPSSPVFASFDNVMLLCDGQTVFYGPPAATVPYFASLGYQCPATYNPADFLMDLVNLPGDEGAKSKHVMIEAFADGRCETAFDDSGARGASAAREAGHRAAARQGRSRSKVFMASFSRLVGVSGAPAPESASKMKLQLPATPEDAENGHAENGHAENGHASTEETKEKQRQMVAASSDDEDGIEGSKWATSWPYQCWVLTQRSFRVAKAEILTWLNLIQCLLLAVISGILWFRLDWTESQVNNRAGFIFFIFTFWPFQALFSSLLTFPSERPILGKERASGSYRLSAYFWAKSFAEAPLRLVFPTLYQVIAYWMAGVRDDAGVFFGFVAFQLLAVLTAESIGFWIGTAFFNPRQALVAASVILLTLMLLGGFFIRNIPSWVAWLRYLSNFKYANDASLGLVFNTNTPCDGSGLLPACQGQSTGFSTGAETLDYLDVQGSVGFNAGLLIAMGVVLRVLAYLNLRFIKPPAGAPGFARR